MTKRNLNQENSLSHSYYIFGFINIWSHYTLNRTAKESLPRQDLSNEFEGDFSFDLSNLNTFSVFSKTSGENPTFPEMEKKLFQKQGLPTLLKVADIATKITKKKKHPYFKENQINI